MKKMLIMAVLVLVLAFLVAGTGWAGPPPMIDQPQLKSQIACPVQGGKINKNLYVDYQGQRVYFCCADCIPIFNKNPEAYLEKMRKLWVVTEKSPGGK